MREASEGRKQPDLRECPKAPEAPKTAKTPKTTKNTEIREKRIETQLRRAVLRRGGLCEKWISGTSGWPDRIVILPRGRIGFVEVKAPGKKPRKLQKQRHSQLRLLGCGVYVLDQTDQIPEILEAIGGGPA